MGSEMCIRDTNKITSYPGATTAECIVLCLGYLSYVWDTSLMYVIFVLCFGKITSHVTRVQLWRSVLSYVWDICLMSGILVLCLVYSSYVWDISLLGILV